MTSRLTRRSAIGAAVIGTSYFLAERSESQTQAPRSANERLRFACIGVGGRGSANTDDASRAGDIVALCDTNDNSLLGKAKAQPQAARYFDFRKLLDEQAKNIDAVVISTADHTHAVIALAAMRLGKHVYCEKPLCRYLGEARQLAEVARRSGVVTQLGNQGAAANGFRRTLDAIRSGAIGPLREVHAWNNRYRRPTGPAAQPSIAQTNPPSTLHWDEWLGPAKAVAYSPDYEAGKWQGWWHFGTGPIGDAASHCMNLAFHAADLRNPLSVEANTSGHNKIAFPQGSRIHWSFAATARRPALTLHWYDGNTRPPPELLHGAKVPTAGCLLIGENGSLSSVDDMNANWIHLPDQSPLQLGADFLPHTQTHFAEFATAIKSDGATISNFADVACPFTETLLWGNLAVWTGTKLNRTEIELAADGQGALAGEVLPTYRAGYEF